MAEWLRSGNGLGSPKSPSIKNLLGVIKAQRAEEAILCPGYLLGTSHEGSNALSVDPTVPLPLKDLIFLHADDDLGAWLLANNGKHQLDLMVLESWLEEAGGD